VKRDERAFLRTIVRSSISGATTCGSRNPFRRTLIALSSAAAARKFLSIVLPIIRTIGTLPGYRIGAIRHQIISVTLRCKRLRLAKKLRLPQPCANAWPHTRPGRVVSINEYE